MLPIKYAVQKASTPAQVLRRLSSFLDYLRGCHIDSILPQEFSRLSACNAEEIQAWSAKLEQGGKDIYNLTAAGQLWLEAVREAFAVAAQRLDEIAMEKQQSVPGLRNRSEAGDLAKQA